METTPVGPTSNTSQHKSSDRREKFVYFNTADRTEWISSVKHWKMKTQWFYGRSFVDRITDDFRENEKLGRTTCTARGRFIVLSSFIFSFLRFNLDVWLDIVSTKFCFSHPSTQTHKIKYLPIRFNSDPSVYLCRSVPWSCYMLHRQRFTSVPRVCNWSTTVHVFGSMTPKQQNNDPASPRIYLHDVHLDMYIHMRINFLLQPSLSWSSHFVIAPPSFPPSPPFNLTRYTLHICIITNLIYCKFAYLHLCVEWRPAEARW